MNCGWCEDTGTYVHGTSITATVETRTVFCCCVAGDAVVKAYKLDRLVKGLPDNVIDRLKVHGVPR